ncbi:MAG TPA: hypothetical protein VK395_03555, partial [Gemmataceae bacterium]|nr:hypothetical protein [Gemmataceae bacterium]
MGIPQFRLFHGNGAKPDQSPAPPSGALQPYQMIKAYGINQIMFGNVAGNGAGQTIAIVDAYDDPTITADLAQFDATFSPQDPALSNTTFTFTKENQTGGTTMPGTDPSGPGGLDWEVEESLDVQWAHSIAPSANIILFEANSPSFADLDTAVQTAAATAGVSAVSMSYSSSEFFGENSYDSVYTTPSTRTGGVTFFAATGDNGEPSGYPAYSPNVVAVGGTTLTLDSNNNWKSEAGWSGSGGGISNYEPQPAYQNGVVTQSSTQRTNPDVAFDADPNSGVAVCDSYDFGTSTPWIQVGGTSLATPMWSGVMAILNQARAISGEPSLYGGTQTLPALYQLPQSDFHDITTGNNGYPAGPGYDLVTGRGTPIANLLVPALAGSPTGGTTSFAISPISSPTTAGTSLSITVTAENSLAQTATGYVGTVHFTSSDLQAVLPSDYEFTTADNGVHTFNVTFDTAGTQSLTVADAVTTSVLGTETGITVIPAAASIFVVSGFPSPTAVGTPANFTVTAKDPYGNTASGYTGTVTFSSSDTQASLPANAALTNGTGTFSATFNSLGTQSLTATDTVTSTITGSESGIVIYSPTVVTSLLVTGFSSTVTAGTQGSVTVTAENFGGQPVTGYTGTVQFTSSDTQAVLPANYTFASSDNGTHTFSVILKTAGTQSLTATDTVSGAITGSQSGITVNPAAASVYVVSGFTSPATAGMSGTFTVAAKDPYGNTATGYRGRVHFTSSDAQAVLPANYTFTSSDKGAHTFSATLKTAGTQSIAGTDTVTSSITGSQSGITVNPAPASVFVVTGFTSPVTAGTSGTFTVTAKDPYNNTATGYVGTVHFTSSDGQAALPGNYKFVSADGGVHTFSATLKTAGTRSLTATDTVTSSITGSQTGITVTPAAASVFAVTGFTSPVTAGTSGTFTVTAKDPYNNTATSYVGTVHFTSSDGQAALPSNYSFTSGDSGVHTFSGTLKTAGAQSIIATDTVTGTVTGSQSGITVNPAAASVFVVTGFTSPVTAGTAGTFSVTAKDAYNNTATGYVGSVHFTSSDGQAALPGNYKFTSADSGVHTFSGTLKTKGTQSLTATDTVTSSITGSQTGITVNPAAASVFVVSGFTSPVTAGTSGTLTVTAKDPYNNTATGYLGSVHFTSSDGQAALPGNYTFTSGDGGVHTFSATLKTAGTGSLTATDTVTGTITGSQTGITVNPAAASIFVVTGFPTPIAAGQSGNFTVTAKDAYSNTAAGYTGTVAFSSSDPLATLPGHSTLTNGSGTFSATFNTTGTQSLTATDTVTSSITGTQSGIVVSSASSGAASLLVTGFPATITAGTAATITVTAENSSNQTVTNYTGTVHFASSDGQAVLPANYTFTSSDNGVHTFSVTLKTAGTESISATDTVTGTITGSQMGIMVNSAAASVFVVTGFTSPVTAGTAGTFTVTAKDPYSNTATGYLGTIHLTSSDGQATLPGNYTFTSGDSGVHTFSATLKTAGTQSLTATDTVTGTITGSQTAITVNPAAASVFVVTGFTSPVTAGTSSTFTVTAKDPYNNTATGYLGTVHLTSSDGQAALPGNYTFTSGDSGVHTFSAALKTAGTESLTATDTVTSTITGSQTGITVNPAAASVFVVTGFTSPVTAGASGTFTVTAKDPYNNTATGYLGTLHLTSSDGQAALPGNYTFTSGDTGVHTFSATLKTAGTESLTATDTVTGTITGSQTGITVNPAAASVFVVNGFTSPVTAGTSGTFTVTAKDPYNNTATGYLGTVHLTSSDGQAALPG